MVLFTDIVNSTGRAEELGDKRWRQLRPHHAIVRRALKSHGGREVDTAGDVFFATFNQPSHAIECAPDIIHRLSGVGVQIRAGVRRAHGAGTENHRGGREWESSS